MRKVIVRRAVMTTASALPPDLHPLLARIYAGRGVSDARELERSLQCMLPPTSLGGVERAAALLAEAIELHRRLVIVADFDADGATSCALGVRALRRLGAEQVDYVVPDRFRFGYGLTPEIVEVAAQHRPDVLLTVDNGISSVAGVAAARERGMQVIVTDHHLPGAVLPQADAIVNPNLPDDAFPSKNLAGVGVIFYTMLALRARLREQHWFERRGLPEPNLAYLLDLVALGTVADVVPLDHNNRVLVEQGLRRIRAGRACPGVQALLQVAGRTCTPLVAADLGFAVGPRLNAAGRLQDMSLGIECLLCDDATQALRIAQRLDALNRERREIEAQMQEQARLSLERLVLDDETELPLGVCLYEADWHQGVIGILAGRIKERWHRPVIAFAAGAPGELKGSARSIPGLHIRDALDSVAARHPGLIERFGGHAMAAGLSIRNERFDQFSAAFDAEVRLRLRDAPIEGVIYSDGELEGQLLCLETAELLREAGPWGQGFPEPVFDGTFEVLDTRVLKERHLRLLVRVGEAAQPVDAVAFNAGEQGWHAAPHVHLAYRLNVNEYRGTRSLQLVVEHLEALGAAH